MEPPKNNSGFEEAQKIIMIWDLTASEEAREKIIFEGDRDQVDRYLKAIDELQKAMSSTSISDDQDKVNSATIHIALARLEDEFRNILLNHTSLIELNSLSCAIDSSSLVHSSAAAEARGEFLDEDDHVD